MKKGKRLLCGALALLLVLSLTAVGTVQRAYATKSEEEQAAEEQKKAEEAAQRQAEMDELERKKQEKKDRIAALQKQIADAKSKKEDVMGTKTLLDQRNQLLMEEITLLGQNVNSYGKDLDTPWDFADLLSALDKIEGDYLLRFMSSQPKDASYKLFDTMARCKHVARQLHLPVQSGCDRVLRAMNRPYDRAKYLDLITYARKVMPDLVLTSDVIIGFPGETEAEAMETVALVEQVRFDALFTFIFSPRPGTPAAKMDDPVPRSEKQKWFDRLCDAQNRISEEIHAGYVGDTLRCLIDGESDDSRWPLTARTAGGRLVHLVGSPDAVGTYRDVKITDSNTWALFGQLI